MSPPWTASRQELERKKLEISAGWIPYPTANEEEEGDAPELGPSKRPRTEAKPTSKLASSSPAAITMSVNQEISGPGCSSVAAAVKERSPATVRKGKRKRAAPTYLLDEAGSSSATKTSTASSKKGNASARRTAEKKKTLTKGTGNGKVVPKTKSKGKGRGKKKAAVTETPAVDSSAQAENIAASALLRIRTLDVAPAGATEQAADAQPPTEGGSPIIDAGEKLRIAERTIDIMAVVASRMERLPDGIRAVLLAFDDESTEAEIGSVEGAAAGPVDGAGVGDGAGAGDGSGAGGERAGMGAAGEAVGGYGGEAFGEIDDDEL